MATFYVVSQRPMDGQARLDEPTHRFVVALRAGEAGNHELRPCPRGLRPSATGQQQLQALAALR